METTNYLGVIVFLACLIVGVFVIPEVIKFLNKRKFKQKQEKCVDLMHLKYLFSSADDNMIMHYYYNDIENSVWCKSEEMNSSGFVKYSNFMKLDLTNDQKNNFVSGIYKNEK